MSQFGVLVYLPSPADPSAMSPEYLEAIAAYPQTAVELGGKVLGASYFAKQRGFAFESSETASSVRGGTTSAGPLIDSELVPAAFFVVSAADLDVATRIAEQHPAARMGGVEVRPLVPEPRG